MIGNNIFDDFVFKKMIERIDQVGLFGNRGIVVDPVYSLELHQY